MADALNIAVSGLLASRRWMDTTSHNIVNVNTEGYSRQRVELSTRTPQFNGGAYFGTGVSVDNVSRVYDAFVVSDMRTRTSLHSQLETFFGYARQADNMLADSDVGVIPVLNSFFNAVQTVADDPTSSAARQVLLSESGSLAARFNSSYGRLSELADGVNTELNNVVGEINGLAGQIARLNKEIIVSGSSGTRQQPNDLLDRRDLALQQLSELVSVTTVEQDDGAVNVFVGKGQALVVGVQAQQLTTTADPFDPTRREIAYVSGAGPVVMSGLVSGGRIGGLLEVRSQVIEPAMNALGRVATAIAVTFNAQHRLGQDLNGVLGEDFFGIDGPAVLARAGSGIGTVSVSVVDVADITASDYRLERNGAAYTLTRLSDDSVTDLSALGFPGAAVTVDGLTLSGAAIADGDSYLIQPTRTAADTFGALVADPRLVAAATPIRAAADLSNSGSGAIGSAKVSSAVNLPLAADITLTFASDVDGLGNPGFFVAGGPSSPVLYDPVTESTGRQLTFPGYGGISVVMSGAPNPGDTFTISANTGGVGDNRNALLLADLQRTLTLAGGSASYGDAYGEMVAQVGTRTHQADLNRQAQASLLEQAVREREAVSGVNLDEEAANLVRFQQTYQASAEVVATINELFQDLLGAIRR